jgi:hypothetical protein
MGSSWQSLTPTNLLKLYVIISMEAEMKSGLLITAFFIIGLLLGAAHLSNWIGLPICFAMGILSNVAAQFVAKWEGT